MSKKTRQPVEEGTTRNYARTYQREREKMSSGEPNYLGGPGHRGGLLTDIGCRSGYILHVGLGKGGGRA